MSSRQHLSGSEKRKKKKIRENEREKQKGAMLSFLATPVTPREEVQYASTSNENRLALASGEENLSEATPTTSTPTEKNFSGDSLEVTVNTDKFPEPITAQLLSTDDSFQPEVETLNLIDEPFPSDVADWPEFLSAEFQQYFINNRPNQYIDKISECSKQVEKNKVRQLHSSAFYKNKVNGEKVLREWLIYSPKSGHVYCYVCKLFSKKRIHLTVGGFNDWKNINASLDKHERSPEHISAISTLVSRSFAEGRVDTEMEKSFLREKEYWKNILQRIVAAIKFLSKNGLAFYGSTTKIFSKGNGNFLSSLEFLSEFDPFLATHLQKYGNPGSGNVSYLSSTICNEFITLLAREVLNCILKDLRVAKYFSIIVDSTPDISHIDQLTLIVRYVLPSGKPVESFLCFVPIFSHTAENLAKVILEKLKSLEINIDYCRGQSYDNASNMSGKYNGLQTKIKDKTESAHFIPCSSHSLNLVGNSAAESCLEASTYFDNVQHLYNFFSASTYRWSVLQSCLEKAKPKALVVKKICDTRWSARADAVKSLAIGFNEIKMALIQLHEDTNQKNSTRSEANDILKKLNSFEFALMTVTWNKLLERINATSKSLQEINTNLTVACELYKSLICFVTNLREQFGQIEEDAKNLQPANTLYRDETIRIRKRKKYFEESSSDEICLVGREKFKICTFLVICDKLIMELKKRQESYNCVNDMFNIFFVDNSDGNFKTSLKIIEQYYSQDIDVIDLENELVQFKEMCKSSTNIVQNPIKMLEFLIETNTVSTFSNVETLLRIYLSIPISNASGERSFSTLKRVKSYLRNSINQENLSSLALLNVENEVLENIDSNEIINKFAEMKIRKRKI